MTAFLEVNSEALGAYIKAIQARRRALKYKFAQVECERIVEDQKERIELRLSSTRRRDALRLSLSLWDDRWCWFDVRRAAPRGWEFEWSYDGRIAPAHAGGPLIAALERSHDFVSGEAPNTAELTLLWSGLLLRGPRR